MSQGVFWLVDFLGSSVGKESTSNTGDLGSIWVRNIPGEVMATQSIFINSMNRETGSYSPWDSQESGTTEQLTHT